MNAGKDGTSGTSSGRDAGAGESEGGVERGADRETTSDKPNDATGSGDEEAAPAVGRGGVDPVEYMARRAYAHFRTDDNKIRPSGLLEQFALLLNLLWSKRSCFMLSGCLPMLECGKMNEQEQNPLGYKGHARALADLGFLFVLRLDISQIFLEPRKTLTDRSR